MKAGSRKDRIWRLYQKLLKSGNVSLRTLSVEALSLWEEDEQKKLVLAEVRRQCQAVLSEKDKVTGLPLAVPTGDPKKGEDRAWKQPILIDDYDEMEQVIKERFDGINADIKEVRPLLSLCMTRFGQVPEIDITDPYEELNREAAA